MTVDDHIPILEVSDSNPTSLGSDFAWLAKVTEHVEKREEEEEEEEEEIICQ